MPVSDRERDYMQRIGQAKAASHAEAAAAHQARTLGERLAASWALYLAGRTVAGAERDDDPTPFYQRARALGLCR